MRLFFIIIAFIFVIQSCHQNKKTGSTSILLDIVKSQNDKFLESIDEQIKIRGNQPSEIEIADKVKNFVRDSRFILSGLDSKNFSTDKVEIDALLNMHVEEIEEFLKFENLINKCLAEGNPENLKISLAFFETKVIEYYAGQIGAEDIHFEKIEPIILPDNYIKNTKENFRGKVILAATSKQVNKKATYTVDGKVTDNGLIEISDPGRHEVEIEFFGRKYKNQIKIEEN